MPDSTSRRSFIGASGAAGLGLMIVKPEAVRGTQANSALSVGLIGCGNRGTYVSGIFAKNEFAKVVAVCDIYEDKLAAAEKKLASGRNFDAGQRTFAAACWSPTCVPWN